ncbi:MAG: recombinase family protein [Candidatus Moraniibacteriota bacterium]
MKYVIYARKSTESEDRQAISIQSQIFEMQEVAKRDGYEVVKIFQESKSAKKPGRPVFAELLDFIATGKAEGILCWKIDRLSRNPVDEGTIKWMLQNETIKRIRTFDREYNPEDNVVIASIEFSMANQYIRDLSKNVKRGLNEKARIGEYPGSRPIGYMTDPKSRHMIPDPAFAPFIDRAFRLYATTNIATDKLADQLYEEGFRSRAGNKVGKSTMHRILTNPIYAGLFYWKGQLHHGNHEPIVALQMYEEVSGRLNKKKWLSAETRRPFPYRGHLVCAECGLKVTAEIQKGHTYYRCTKSKGVHNCSQPYIREEVMETLISESLELASFNDEIRECIVEATKTRLAHRVQMEIETEERLRNELRELKKRKDSLLEKYIADTIPVEMFNEKNEQFVTEEAGIMEKIQNVRSTGMQLTEEIETIVNYMATVHDAFKDGDENRQKEILEISSSNIGIKDRKIAYFNLNDAFRWVYDDASYLTAQKATFEPSIPASTKEKTAACATALPMKLGR